MEHGEAKGPWRVPRYSAQRVITSNVTSVRGPERRDSASLRVATAHHVAEREHFLHGMRPMVLAVRCVIKILEPEQPLRKCHLAPFGVTQHDARSSSTGAGTGTGWE